jgi:hypothetical protein
MYVAVVLNINFEFLLGEASAQIDSGIWILPHILDYSKWPQVSQKLEKSKKNWRGVSRTVRSIQKCNKKGTWTKTLSVKFLSRIFAQPVRSPLGVSYAKSVSFPIENILFVTTIRSVHKIGIMGRMYLLIGERNTQHIKYSPVRSSCSPKKSENSFYICTYVGRYQLLQEWPKWTETEISVHQSSSGQTIGLHHGVVRCPILVVVNNNNIPLV